MQLQELFESLTSVKDFNATKLSAEDIVELLDNSGYTEGTEVHSITQAGEKGYFAYGGSTNTKSHRYVFAWFDEDVEDEPWVISDVYVELAKDGKIDCHYGGVPIDSFESEDELKKYFKRLHFANISSGSR